MYHSQKDRNIERYKRGGGDVKVNAMEYQTVIRRFCSLCKYRMHQKYLTVFEIK